MTRLFATLLAGLAAMAAPAAESAEMAATDSHTAAPVTTESGGAWPVSGLQSPKHEVRAVWLTTIGGLDWPHSYAQSAVSARRQQRELCDILDRLQQAGVNTVLLQTRVRATTIFPSAMEPWDGCLSGFPGRSPGYDALRFAIDECHRRGMALHAWVVAIPVGRWNGAGCQRLKKTAPGLLRKIGNEGFMNPEAPGTAGYLARFCREIVENYDVDGIHLDYIRYPETWPAKVDGDRGRANITRIVERIHDAVKAVSPWVRLSCSPIGKHDDLPLHWSHGWNARTRVCQDAQEWLRRGLMDELYPMMYFRGEQFYPFALDWKESDYGRTVAAGLGVYMLAPSERDWDAEVIEREMNVCRLFGLGHAYFRSRFFTGNTKGIYDRTRNFIDAVPALTPPMSWASPTPPGAPAALSVKHFDDGDSLSWTAGADRSGGPYLTYNVYRSDSWPVDTSDARNLIAARLTGLRLFVPAGSAAGRWHYAVTAADRYDMESAPAMSPRPADSGDGDGSRWLPNDGRTLVTPPRGTTLDAGYLAIESITGVPVRVVPWTAGIPIAALPEGVYTLRSLGHKGVTHRIGRFIIRRTR